MRTAYARYAKGFRKPLSHLSHLSRWRVVGEETWTAYRNHRDFLQKLPWFLAIIAVISWRSCRDFLQLLRWFLVKCNLSSKRWPEMKFRKKRSPTIYSLNSCERKVRDFFTTLRRVRDFLSSSPLFLYSIGVLASPMFQRFYVSVAFFDALFTSTGKITHFYWFQNNMP